MNTAEILRHGADTIEQYGWWRKGNGIKPTAIVLPDGRVACSDEPLYLDSSLNACCLVTSVNGAQQATRAIAQRLGVAEHQVAIVNDQQPLTVDSWRWAVDVLRGAADDVERREREAVSA